ncbi:hypothetical protein QCA50_003169 [Cerrena zonata]|uniref:Uncharacterized protein n=1 Tax=Cerrena zonata TaxID=2478898 RepID=A0AAW0GK38_9APHY
MNRTALGSRLRRGPLLETYIRHSKPRCAILNPLFHRFRMSSTQTPSAYEPFQPPISRDDWTRSDHYHNSFLIPKDEALDFALKNSDDNGLPPIAVSPAQGKLLNLIARSINAKRIIEVGTLGGYSTIWLARALPEDGKLVTAELEQKHADVARANLEHAGQSKKVEILVGSAAESLAKLKAEPPYDLVFIDADKVSTLTYFLEAKRLLRNGGVVIVDNVVREGRVADPNDTSESSVGIRKLLEHLKNDREVDATTIATVGEKAYDGFLYAVLQ